MRMDIIKESLNLLEDLYIPENNLTELFERMIRKKKSLNDLLGITSDNNYRIVIPSSMTEEYFINNFPRTYNIIKELCGDSEFNLTGNWIKCPTKRKLSKYINKIINSRCTSSNQLRYIYEELGISDVMSIFDMVKPKNVIISTNMYDFFSSSTNTPFRSCYNITGSHFNGNIAYMEDTFTFMIYTATDELNKKIGRTWAYLTKGSNVFMTSRLYGSIYSQEIKVAVDYIKSKFPEINKWIDERVHYEYFHNAKPYSDDMVPVYFDNEYITIYEPDGTAIDLPELYFKNIKCLECGETTNNGHYGRCERCMENISHCEYCDKLFHVDTSIHSSVCKDCVEKHFKPCTICGTKSYSLHDIDGEHICYNCMEKNYQQCRICGKFVKSESHVTNFVCKECEHLVKTCDVCGNLIILTSEVPFILNGGIQCSRCGKNNIRGLIFPVITRGESEELYIDGIQINQEWIYNDVPIETRYSEGYIRLYVNGIHTVNIDFNYFVERLVGNEVTIELIRNIIYLYLLREIGYMEIQEYIQSTNSGNMYRMSLGRVPSIDEELVARVNEENPSYINQNWEPASYNDLELTYTSRNRLEVELGLNESRERLEEEIARIYSESRYVTTHGTNEQTYVSNDSIYDIEESFNYYTNIVGTSTNGIGNT